jgi:hypothetical protein
MARLSRKLGVCKWIGTVGCVLIAVAWMISIAYAYGFALSRMIVDVGQGQFVLEIYDRPYSSVKTGPFKVSSTSVGTAFNSRTLMRGTLDWAKRARSGSHFSLC